MTRKFAIVSIFSLCLISCQNENKLFTILEGSNKIEVEVSLVDLKGKNLEIDLLFGEIVDIKYINQNQFLIVDIKANGALAVLDLKKDEITELIKIGDGPDEISDNSYIKINTVTKDGIINFFKFASNSLFQTNSNIPNSINNVFNYSNEYIQTQHITAFSDSTLVLAGLNNTTFFNLIKADSQISAELPIIGELNRELSPEEIQIIQPTILVLNEDKQQVIIYNLNSTTVRIYSKEGRELKSYSFGQNENITDNGLMSTFAYYYAVKVVNDNIYALYGGFNLFDNFTESVIPHLKSELHVFNIKNDEIKRYNLGRLINVCSLDPVSNLLYCIEENNEENPIVVYEMD